MQAHLTVLDVPRLTPLWGSALISGLTHPMNTSMPTALWVLQGSPPRIHCGGISSPGPPPRAHRNKCNRSIR